MRLCILVSAVCMLSSAVAQGQWSEPSTLASGLGYYGAGPELVPQGGDTIWVFWMGDAPPRLLGRCFEADTWHDPEQLAEGTAGIYWPTGTVDDSGHMLVACYEGSYPAALRLDQDTWGIYTMTRTDTGWTTPALAQDMAMQGFPTYLRLGKARDGSVGMIWDESSGGMSAAESAMVSRKEQSGWTPRRCLAPGSYPDIYCHCGSLVPGDTTDFCIAFSRLTNPDTSEVEVWDLDDSLVHTPAVFPGALPMLARGQASRFLVLTRGDTLLGAVNDGEGWGVPAVIATGVGWGGAALCTDPFGWGWTCWPDSAQQSVLASYNSGAGWSRPETVATSSALGAPRVASDGLGNLHCVWFDHTGGGSGELRHARRLARPGLAEEGVDVESQRTAKLPAGVLRGILCLPVSALTIRTALFDMTGRPVMELHPGPNDVSGLAPGVYFVREAQAQAQAQSIRKVVITR
jgi:hypothetical protein